MPWAGPVSKINIHLVRPALNTRLVTRFSATVVRAGRLSDFNAGGNAKALGHKPVYATTVQTANWSPDNRYFYGDVETNLLNSDSVIARVALTCHGS